MSCNSCKNKKNEEKKLKTIELIRNVAFWFVIFWIIMGGYGFYNILKIIF